MAARRADYYAVPWRGKWATELGGVLVTHALHPHDMASATSMGPVDALFGRVATRVNAIEVEDCVSASLEMESGALALAHLHARLAGRDQPPAAAFENVTFESDHAAYSPGQRPLEDPAAQRRGAARGSTTLLGDWQPVGPRFTTQMARFHEALDGRRPLPVTSADARRALELVTAFYHSSDTGAEVALPIGPDSPKYADWRARTR